MGFGIIVKRKATGNQSFSLVRFSLVHREDEISDCQSESLVGKMLSFVTCILLFTAEENSLNHIVWETM